MGNGVVIDEESITWYECPGGGTEIVVNRAAQHEPPPTPGSVIILDLVLKDLQDRANVGKEKYGTYLMAHNGRDALMDAYQEALDLCMYLRQLLYERDNV
jgi:hypothetical protein